MTVGEIACLPEYPLGEVVNGVEKNSKLNAALADRVTFLLKKFPQQRSFYRALNSPTATIYHRIIRILLRNHLYAIGTFTFLTLAALRLEEDEIAINRDSWWSAFPQSKASLSSEVR